MGAIYGSTYIGEQQNIYANEFHAAPISYFVTDTGLSADSAGDIIVLEGTVLKADAAVAGSGRLQVRGSSGTAVAVLAERVNLRTLGEKLALVQVQHADLLEPKCTDSSTYGNVDSASKTALLANGIRFFSKPGSPS